MSIIRAAAAAENYEVTTHATLAFWQWVEANSSKSFNVATFMWHMSWAVYEGNVKEGMKIVGVKP